LPSGEDQVEWLFVYTSKREWRREGGGRRAERKTVNCPSFYWRKFTREIFLTSVYLSRECFMRNFIASFGEISDPVVS